jgi:uncharacterized repeat protein (TIGR01451 family)
MRIVLLAAALSVASAATAQTAPTVSLVSKTQVVVTVTDAKGNKKRSLVDPKTVVPGQPIVIWLTYKNNGKAPATSFVINNPVPKGLDFTSFGDNSDWGMASADGGKSFGALASLKVTGVDKKSRPATPADVTHLRWTFAKPIAPGAGGTISFYAVVE